MNKVLTTFLIIMLVLAVALTGFLIYTINTDSFSWDFFNGSGYNPPLVNTESFDSEGIEKLYIEYSSDRVEILKSDSDKIVLEEYMKTHKSDMNAKTNIDGTLLSIVNGKRPIINISMSNSHVKIYVPDSWGGDFEYKGASGSFYCEDNWSFKSLNVKSISSSMLFGEISAENEIELKNASGSIRAEHLTSENKSVNVSNTSGSIAISNIDASADIKLSNSSGSIRTDILTSIDGAIQVSGTSGSLDVGTVSAKGDINLTNSAGSIKSTVLKTGANVDIKGSSGSIKLETVTAQNIKIKSSAHIGIEHSTGKVDIVGTSGSIKLFDSSGYGSIKNTSGSIMWELSAVQGDIDVNGTSGSVKVNVPEDSSFSAKMKSTSGSIKSDFEDMMFEQDKKTAVVQVGSEPRHNININSTAGSISLSHDA